MSLPLRLARGYAALAAPLLTIELLLGATACGGGPPGPAYYLASGGTGSNAGILLIQWGPPSQDGRIQGTVTGDSIGTDSSGYESLSVNTLPFTGKISGGNVTFRFTSLFSSGTITGTLGNGTLTITLPPDATTGAIQSHMLAAADAASYNRAVTRLRAAINRANEITATAQRDQADINALASAYATVTQDQATVRGDLSTLAGDVSTVGGDDQTVYGDLQTVIGDAKDPSNNQDGTTCADASTADADASTAAADASTFQADLQTLTSDLATLRADIHRLNAALSTVQADLPSFTGGNGAPSVAQVQQEINGTFMARQIRKTNGYIDQVNAEVATAYRYDAQASAVDNCGTASQPPAPISHIS